jgi:hypothetical protein
MAELVESRRPGQQPQQEQYQAGLTYGLLECRSKRVEKEEPAVEQQQAAHEENDHQGHEQGLQHEACRVHQRLRDHGCPQAECQHAGRASADRSRFAGGRHYSARHQPGLDQMPDVVGPNSSTEPAGDHAGNVAVAVMAIGVARHQVEQARHVHGLPVWPPRKVGLILESRALVFADQFDAVGEAGRGALDPFDAGQTKLCDGAHCL